MKSSKVVGRRIEELPKIKGVHIGAIVRQSEPFDIIGGDGMPKGKTDQHVIIPHHDTVIESGDHVIVFCTRKAQVKEVEKLFQVGFMFF
jgi:trk system potassium uptake protein TrkA